MEEQKIESLLNAALEAGPAEREKSLDLNVGFDKEEKRWELIVKYSNDISALEAEGVQIVYLMNNYAILKVPEDRVERIAANPQIEFVEKPKRLFFADSAGRQASCITPVQSGQEGLSGKGVMVALIDSGVDYTHPDFRNTDGTTRILALWDQTVKGPQTVVIDEDESVVLEPPEGYYQGILYNKELIDIALEMNNAADRDRIVPSMDYSGHGTQVLGVAAGNGRQGGQALRGVAYESDLLVVKLGNPDSDSFPRTTELMQGINFALEEGIRRQQPVVLNISFGNNYGSHDGTSLLETYINDVSSAGRTSIVIGTGNEGAASGHTSGVVRARENKEVLLSVGEYQTNTNIQIWKNFVDEMDLEIITPSGRSIGPIQERLGAVRVSAGNTELLVYYGTPSPYSASQEIYIEMLSADNYIDFGLWTLRLIPIRIVDGGYRMWLPGGSARNRGTRFLDSTPYLTLTIPSTASKVISVGAYHSGTGAMADFSGRGNDGGCMRVGGCMPKPDLVAPGVGIQTTAVGGGYTYATGTSFATPFVSGSAALLMQWGIVLGNSPYLYGADIIGLR